jgi:hypothetical protein
MTEEELTAEIKKVCEARGMIFKPWEVTPWSVSAAVGGRCPWPAGTAGAESWQKAVTLRNRLIAEIEGRGAPLN